jgi:hypothetical protein
MTKCPHCGLDIEITSPEIDAIFERALSGESWNMISYALKLPAQKIRKLFYAQAEKRYPHIWKRLCEQGRVGEPNGWNTTLVPNKEALIEAVKVERNAQSRDPEPVSESQMT